MEMSALCSKEGNEKYFLISFILSGSQKQRSFKFYPIISHFYNLIPELILNE